MYHSAPGELMSTFALSNFDLSRYDAILARGLSNGKGDPSGQMCIEAAICATLGLPHGDDPGCVATAVRAFKIALNDSQWPSPQARATGLYKLGLAQLGSKGVVDDRAFSVRLAQLTIQQLIPKLFREVFPSNQACLDVAKRCEIAGSARTDASYAAPAHAAYLTLSADLALEVLKELNSPGCQLLVND